MNVLDVLSKAQVFNSLMACGMKLFWYNNIMIWD